MKHLKPIFLTFFSSQSHTDLPKTLYQNASSEDINEILRLYPQDPSAGSPYDTGHTNSLTPISKQVASLFGDALLQVLHHHHRNLRSRFHFRKIHRANSGVHLKLQVARRKFLKASLGRIPSWSYLDKGYKWVPIIGKIIKSLCQSFTS